MCRADGRQCANQRGMLCAAFLLNQANGGTDLRERGTGVGGGLQ